MLLTGFWRTDEQDALYRSVYSRRFKIQRGRNSEQTARVSDEKCYGVLCYEKGVIFSPISEIIAPILALEWAQKAVAILDEIFPNATVSDWEEIEAEMRRQNYTGESISLVYLPDAVGFQLAQKIGDYSTAELEESGKGFVEKVLVDNGFKWDRDLRTWVNPSGDIWIVKDEIWQNASKAYNLPPQIPRSDLPSRSTNF